MISPPLTTCTGYKQLAICIYYVYDVFILPEDIEMVTLESQVATHVVRSHRSLRRQLPDVVRLGDIADDASESMRVRAAKQAGRFLDRKVLAHADIEDVLVDRYLDGPASRGSAARLQPQHDTLRAASVHLHDFVDAPTDDVGVAGMIRAVGDTLHGHLDDEWRVLVPALSTLDGPSCNVCEPLVAEISSRPTARFYLPGSFASADRLLTRWPRQVRARVSAAAAATIRRRANHLGLPLRRDLDVVVELVPVLRSPHVSFYVGRLRSRELETMVSPVDIELVVSPQGDRFVQLEAHHTLTPARALPVDAPAHQLTHAAVHAVVGELATIASDQ